MKIGVLLTNIGTPDEPTPTAVHCYLKEFLSDPRVVKIPFFLWQPILQGWILPRRSKTSAKLYQKIWTEKGSPLLVHMQQLVLKVQEKLQQQWGDNIPVALGMRYGNPTISAGLEKLKAAGVSHIIILPLYPQYSTTTTASTEDAIKLHLQHWQPKPDTSIIQHYATEPLYIRAMVQSIKAHWQTVGKEHLLFSFHGIPQKYVNEGDPYADLCRKTTHAIVADLGISADEWSMSYQSRLGPSNWLKPYTIDVLQSLPKKGIVNLHVICPGFSVDCLETLEEIAIRGKEQFLSMGGHSFDYIPALNASEIHSDLIAHLICQTPFPK